MLVNSPSDVPQAAIDEQPETQRKYHAAILGWLTSALEEGEGFLRAQRGYEDIDRSIATIMGDVSQSRPGSNNLEINQFGKIALDLKGITKSPTNASSAKPNSPRSSPSPGGPAGSSG
jgi:hypothetical protein